MNYWCPDISGFEKNLNKESIRGRPSSCVRPYPGGGLEGSCFDLASCSQVVVLAYRLLQKEYCQVAPGGLILFTEILKYGKREKVSCCLLGMYL